jgi:AraC-like DNA-binding protein
MLATNGPYCIYIHAADDSARKTWSIPQRRLTFYLLVCSISGEEQIIMDGKTYRVPPRGCYLVPPAVLSDLGSRRGSRPGWIHFDAVWNPERAKTPHVGAYAPELAGRSQFLQPPPREIWGVDFQVQVPDALQALFADAIPRIIGLVKRGDRLAYLEATTTLSSLMLTWVAYEWKRVSPAGGFDIESRLARAELLARQNLGAGFSVADFARAANLSRSQFSAIYHKLRGIRPGKFLRQERLRQAETLLLRSELPLAEVGALVGYPDPSVLGRVFRAAHGLSPREWRRAKI